MTIHVYPLNDWIDHDIDSPASECQCPCEQRIEWLDEVQLSYPGGKSGAGIYQRLINLKG